jgi:pyridoxine 5-phosphate synthase
MHTTQLSININKLATLRNARGKNNPDVVSSALKLIELGAQGITVHPRPDERHIRRQDVYDLRIALREKAPLIEFNIEGYPSEDFLKMVEDVLPEQCTLVPDPPEAITSNAGWNVQANFARLKSVGARLQKKGIRSSVFVDPLTVTAKDYRDLKSFGIDRVELYTERFAETFGHLENVNVLKDYARSAKEAREAGLGLNAGHDLTAENLPALVKAIPDIDEVSIGHALVADALWAGFKETIAVYLRAIAAAQSERPDQS